MQGFVRVTENESSTKVDSAREYSKALNAPIYTGTILDLLKWLFQQKNRSIRWFLGTFILLS